jgi:hypothetical protein
MAARAGAGRPDNVRKARSIFVKAVGRRHLRGLTSALAVVLSCLGLLVAVSSPAIAEVVGGPVAADLAIGAAVTQSSTAAGAGPRLATDGVTDGNAAHGSVAQTTSQAQPWWQVDLGSVASIATIALWNRTDCCAGQLSGFHVLVSNVPFTGSTLAQGQATPGVLDLSVAGQAGRPTTLPVNRTGRYVRVQLSGTGALSLAEVQVFAAGATVTTDPETITADVLPTPQTNGTVYALAIVGNTVYAGGQFTSARPYGSPAGTNEAARKNLLAFDLTTGALLPWAPVVAGTPFTGTADFCTKTATGQTLCDTVFRIRSSPDGSRIYVGGDFTSINGTARYRVAAFDTATGNLVTTFRPAVSSRVRALGVTADRVYIGGAFTSVDGTARQHITAVDLTGKAVAGFNASTDFDIWGMAPSSDGSRVVVGGRFGKLSGVARMGLGTVMAADGSAGPWDPTVGTMVVSSSDAVTDVAVDGPTAFASGFSYTPGVKRFEGRLAADVNTGKLVWHDRCFGDTQAVAVAGGVVYGATHSHDCGYLNVGAFVTATTYQRITAETVAARGKNKFGEPRPDLLVTFPNTNGGPSGCTYCNGPWSVAANGTYVVYGGEFTTVNGAAQQGLVRFAVRSLAPRKIAPIALGTPTVSPGAQTATLSWTSAWDRDNAMLTYNILRDGVAVGSVRALSYWWSQPRLTWTDRGVPTGKHSYVVQVIDSDGNGTRTSPVTVAVP